jgi:tetratricopeptide (TPR) repeat protein
MNKFIKYLTIIVFLSSALSVSAQSDEKAIRRGNRSYKSANYEQAIAQYKKALEIRPNNAKAQFNLVFDVLLRDFGFANFQHLF